MNIERLTDEAIAELALAICSGLRRDAVNDPDVLQEIVNWLDSLDEEDFFGTEGWKHRFGVED